MAMPPVDRQSAAPRPPSSPDGVPGSVVDELRRPPASRQFPSAALRDGVRQTAARRASGDGARHAPALVAGILLVLTLPAAGMPVCPDVESARQQARIATTYDLNPYLRDADIHVSVEAGTATLRGLADNEVSRALAGEIARRTDGISRVDNRLTIDRGNPGGAARAAEAIDDSTIAASIKFKLLWSKQADGLAVHVASRRGRVTLTGTAPDPASRKAAVRIAAGTRGVTAVDDQLALDPEPVAADPDPATTPPGAAEVLADTWITTTVKATLLFSSQLDGAGITVRTEGGVVTLEGIAGGGTRGNLAIDLARDVRGVDRVVPARADEGR
jgi:osmotically-inducible protein OsmY